MKEIKRAISEDFRRLYGPLLSEEDDNESPEDGDNGDLDRIQRSIPEEELKARNRAGEEDDSESLKNDKE